MTVVHHN